jgi:hypothetical protein
VFPAVRITPPLLHTIYCRHPVADEPPPTPTHTHLHKKRFLVYPVLGIMQLDFIMKNRRFLYDRVNVNTFRDRMVTKYEMNS